MTKVVSSVSNGKKFDLQMSLDIKAIGKEKYIRIRYLETGEEELYLKFNSKNQRNLDTEIFFPPDLSLLVIHCCQWVKHQAVRNII